MFAKLVPSKESPFFTTLWQTYTSSFPPEEYRSLANQELAFAHPNYYLEAWFEDQEQKELVGLMGWWDFARLRYVEHLAIRPELRSLGWGEKILKTWLALDSTPAVLEVDPVVDEISRRRLEFYLHLGFVENSMEHGHPSYKDGQGEVPMRLLSYPGPISQEEYAYFLLRLQKEAWSCIG